MIEGSEAEFRDKGFLLLKGFLDYEKEILPIHKEINALIDLKLCHAGLEPTKSPEQSTIRNEDFYRLIKKDRALGGDIYRACRHLLSLYQLVSNEKMLSMAGRLMDTETINVLSYVGIRIDVPSEEKYLFPWHQDYPYTQGSMDGLVFWLPFFDVPVGHGNIQLIPGSHRDGLRKVKLVDPENKGGSGAHTLEIEDMESCHEFELFEAEVKAGDALVFSTLTLHKSTPSQSSSIRWTSQIRYGNFSNEDSVRRGWPGGLFEGDKFEDRHPEYVSRK
jgi:hypothetical protein